MDDDAPNLETRARIVFDELADLPADRRDAALIDRCGQDEPLQARVRSLLAAHESANGFLQPPPPLFGFDADAPATAESMAGRSVGRYRIVREIASGGMGVVYLAEQAQPSRVVALKVMRIGLASRAMLRRFEHEAEVLGQLRHPGIAQVFEAGAFDDGRGAQPYFAMEYVDGVTITRHARTRGLDARARLELLADVCDAVQHAHQKGVVHRDLKPDNILVPQDVTDDAAPARFQPKILDFGVARLVNTDIAVATMQTEVGQVLGTLPYMSPEQALGDPTRVDTRSDVYALGVVAYELLTGAPPLDLRHKSMAEAARMIADDEPPPLTSVDRSLRGDVSTIVAKALEKDRDRRYQSASELAADIRRFLRHEPIQARPATTLYQLRRFARRNRALVAGVCGVFLMLLLGVIGTSVGLVQARESARLARLQEDAATIAAGEAMRQRAAAEQISRFLQQMLASVSPAAALGRDTTLVREVLDNASRRVEAELADQPDIAATLHGVIGRTYASIAEYPPAITHLQRAVELRDQVSSADSMDAAKARGDLGRALLSADRFTEAGPLFDAALRTTESREGGNSVAAAMARTDIAVQRRHAGDFDAAESMLRRSAATLDAALPADDPARLRTTVELASVLLARRKFKPALPLFEEVLAAHDRDEDRAGPALAQAEANVARTLLALGRFDEADSHMSRALAIYRQVLPPDHSTLAGALLTMSNIHYKRHRPDEAAAVLEEALQANRRTFGERSAAAATILAAQSTLAESRLDSAEAERLALIVLDIRREVLPPDHPDLAASLRQVASLRYAAGDPDQAVRLVEEALAIQRAHGAFDYDACESLINLASREFALNHPAEAEHMGKEALATMTRLLGDDHPSVLTATNRVAKFLEAQRKFEESLELRRGVLARVRQADPPDVGELSASLDATGLTLMRLDRFAEAQPLIQESLELRVREYGDDHFTAALSRVHMGMCLTGLGDFASAETLLLAGEAGWVARSGAAAPQTREARQALVDLYEAWSRPDDAARWREALISRRTATRPATQPASQPAG